MKNKFISHTEGISDFLPVVYQYIQFTVPISVYIVLAPDWSGIGLNQGIFVCLV